MNLRKKLSLLLLSFVAVQLAAVSLHAHCDRLDGPVAVSAREALESGEFALIQIWVGPEQESELKQVFEQAIAVRATGEAAQELADRYFMETAVRLHREAEGMPYTGLQPAGLPLPADIKIAEIALETGELAPVEDLLKRELTHKLSALFREAIKARRDAEDGVEAGRQWTDAYVRYIVFVHSLYGQIQQGPAHGIHD